MKRMSRVALGYGADWQMVRNAHINEHPWCVACAEQGVQTPASEVDHIQPVRSHPELRLEPSNLRSLCLPCHSRRTALDTGFGR